MSPGTKRPPVRRLQRHLAIGVDVDEVVADLLSEWVARYNRDYGDRLTREDMRLWDMTKNVRTECGAAIFAYLRAPDLYDDIQPMPGATVGVARLRADGHTVHFITSCEPGPMADAKRAWLQRHGFLSGELPSGHYHVCTGPDSKRVAAERLGLDLLIDDRPENLMAMPRGVGRILFDAPHNRGTVATDLDAYRASDWPAALRFVEVFAGTVGARYQITERGKAAVLADNANDARRGSKPSNPKDVLGSDKLPLSLWPATATAMGCLGMEEGLVKYGRDNFRAIGIRASIYIDAAKRHLDAWFEGEEEAPDSGLPHLANALASIAIIVDARAAGKMIDDRKVAGGYRALINELTPHVRRLKALHADKHPRHYTIADNEELAAAAAAAAEEDDARPTAPNAEDAA